MLKQFFVIMSSIKELSENNTLTPFIKNVDKTVCRHS